MNIGFVNVSFQSGKRRTKLYPQTILTYVRARVYVSTYVLNYVRV